MKKLALVALASLSLNAMALPTLPARSYCTALEQNLSVKVAQAQNAFEVGEVTRVDVFLAEVNYLNARLECGSVVRGTVTEPYAYCYQQNWYKVTTMVDGMKEEARAGARSAVEVSEAELVKAAYLAICE